MVVDHPFSIQNGSGDPVRGNLRFQDDGRRKPLILICHGFNTNKDWGPFPYCGEFLADSGFATIVFDFSHNGVGEEPGRFTEYSRFSKNTPGKELEDIQAVLDAVSDGLIGKECVDNTRIGMAGHSRGAGMSVLTAAADSRIRAIVLWSTVAVFLRLNDEERRRWVEKGYHPLRYGNQRTMLRYDISVLNDLEENRTRYDLEQGSRRLSVPALFLHGDSDEIVPLEETLLLYRQGKSRRDLQIIKGADHTYGTEHPFRGTTPPLTTMLQLTKQWFEQYLENKTT
ncbi:MAG: alpha/beta fold hydrolase [Ignavibacteria bacterium]|nr:alpha/beta fold hydrolase [Ignavibacteria bacterium]